MARMWPVATKSDVGIPCGFMGAPRARASGLEMAISERGARADWFHGSPNRNATQGHVSELPFWVWWVREKR